MFPTPDLQSSRPSFPDANAPKRRGEWEIQQKNSRTVPFHKVFRLVTRSNGPCFVRGRLHVKRQSADEQKRKKAVERCANLRHKYHVISPKLSVGLGFMRVFGCLRANASDHMYARCRRMIPIGVCYRLLSLPRQRSRCVALLFAKKTKNK